MTPFANTWALITLGQLLPACVWSGAAVRTTGTRRAAWVVAAGASLLHFAVDAGRVLDGGLPAPDAPWWVPQLVWLALAVHLALDAPRPRQPASLRTFAAAAALVLIEAWAPAVVVLGTGRLERDPPIRSVALLILAGSVWTVEHRALELAAWVGRLGLGVDTTTIATAWLSGGALALTWAWALTRPAAAAPPSPPSARPASRSRC